MDDYRAPTPDTVPGGKVVHTDALKALLDRGGVVLVDVLPAPRQPAGMKPGTPWMPEPHRDLPGSLWLPDVGRGAISAALDAWFRARLAQATGEDKGRTVVFYCLKDCWMSWNAAKRAASFGYRDVLWYPEGVDGWREAGLALREATPETPPG
jgi:PQQ-dependent catabolism-associated CXXCW motif protein